jgi:hypothetical protein
MYWWHQSVDFYGISFPLNSKRNIYSSDKLSLTYLEIPVEMVLKPKSGLILSLGFSAGLLLDAHSKVKFNNPPDFYGPIQTVKYKIKDNQTFNHIRPGPELRIGYKHFSLYGLYEMGSCMKNLIGTNPFMHIYSIGIMLAY